MDTEFLIVGQGISGTLLSWNLSKAGRDFVMIDEFRPSSSSRVAAGIINPVTGRRVVQTWMIEELLPFAVENYTELGAQLKIQAIRQLDIISFFPSPQMLIEFRNRNSEGLQYISMPQEENNFRDYFSYDFGYGIIASAYAVNLAEILSAWRKQLADQLIEEVFDISDLVRESGKITYRGIKAKKIIFCDGVSSFNHPWFRNLPFAQNKGQALIIRNAALPKEFIFKKAMTIVPLREDYFWVGSSYEWDFETQLPTDDFMQRTRTQLNSWIKSPYTVEAHLSSMRPATLERRPFVGLHPLYPEIGILNGMGTKGCSLAPWFAHQLTDHLLHGTAIKADADLARFKKVLSRAE